LALPCYAPGMAGRYSSTVERAGEVLARYLRRHHVRNVQEHAIANKWVELVGEQIAAHTQPLSLKDGLLNVVVASAAWLNELSLLRGPIVQRINELLGENTVAAIRLLAGRVRPSPRPAPIPEQPSYVELPPEEVERIEHEVTEVSDPELRAAIRQARLAQLARLLRRGG